MQSSFDSNVDCSDEINKSTSEHLWKIANVLPSCPAASRFYLYNLERNLSETTDLLNISSERETLYCKHCGSLWSPGNYRVRVLPRPSLNRHLKKLLKLEAEQSWRLNLHQKNKLKKFKGSSNKIVYSCITCNKKTIFPGDKKNNVHLRTTSSSNIPLPKIKKGDLNAGLFIPSPSCSTDGNRMDNEKNKSIVSSKRTDVETPLKCEVNFRKSKNFEAQKTPQEDKAPIIENEIRTFRYQITPNVKTKTPESTVSTSAHKKAGTKKRKSLLDQILKQEQGNKKKTSLASFLVSLS